MSTKQVPISEFCAHPADELAAVETGGTLVELTRDGEIVAYVSPAPRERGTGGTLGDWIGSGAGTVAYAPGVDPDEPAFTPEEWEEFAEDAEK